VAHDQRSLTKIPPQPPFSFEATVLINGQGARAGEPQQLLFGNDPEAAHITGLPQPSNSHDAAQQNRHVNPKDSSFVVQSEGPEGDPAKMRRDLGIANVYPGNAPGQHNPLTRAEKGQPFESSRVDVETDLNSHGIVRGSAGVSSTPATDVRNENQNSSYQQNPRNEAGETFQISSERSEGGPDAGPVHFMRTTDHVTATSAREPQDRNWHPVIDRVVGEISGRIHIGKQEAVLQLDPAELGKVQIDLRMEGDKLAARILTETPESRALIEAHLPELRQALVENRVELVEIRVDSGSWDGQRGEGQKSQQEAGAWLQTARASGEVRPGDAEKHERARPASVRLEPGRVSMWA
jgi:hypothetical protein